MLENALGYAGWFVDNIRNEKVSQSAISQNKAAFKRYVESFGEGREVVAMKKKQREDKEAKVKEASVNSSPRQASSPLASAVLSGHLSPEKYVSRVISSGSAEKFKPTIPSRTRVRKSVSVTQVPAACTSTENNTVTSDDEELLAITVEFEKSLGSEAHVHQPTIIQQPGTTEHVESELQQGATTSLALSFNDIDPENPPLPEGWKKTLPKSDHLWVSQALFTTSRNGKARLDWDRVDKLWWYPPQPPLITSQPPRPDLYFAQRLLLWMPRKLWKVTLNCPHQECEKQPLTSAGIYNTVRQVVDIDSNYNLAAEYLECKNCKRKVISWSPGIIKQLDMGHRLQFPVLLTYQCACDVRVIRLLRQRGLGNSSTQLQKKLSEEHSEKYLQQSAQYLTECKYFSRASRFGLTSAIQFKEPPQFNPVPKYKWLLTVYAQDILSRMDFIKSSITSTFGRILKMDSTKKIVRKLAGSSSGTASWATNIGNERGQVLISVLTVNEGIGLEKMANGLMRRYSEAGVTPPEVLYVDRDCCSATKTKDLFSLWEKLVVRLDIWHFMRRIAVGCNTEAHPLYSVFLSRLSQCIFQWCKDDLDLLKSAKKSELQKQGIAEPSDAVIISKISKRELALHCRRQTRGIAQTATMIYDLLLTFTGPQGCDSTGVPLLNSDRIWDIWDCQQRHIACIQDAEDVQLYTKTGQLSKGDVTLPTYRCARGSTSLESFHLHINRFIPGTSASAMHFQAYLLEGLMRWNADRASDAVSSTTKGPVTYSGALYHYLNELSGDVLGKKINPDVPNIGIYTGECIGVEYLFNQTGEVLKEDNLEDEEVQQPEEEPLSDVDPEQLDEGFEESDDET